MKKPGGPGEKGPGPGPGCAIVQIKLAFKVDFVTRYMFFLVQNGVYLQFLWHGRF